MANGVVRQLITRLSFQVDQKKLDGFKRSVNGIKAGLNNFVSGFKTFVGAASGLALTLTGLVTSASVFAGLLGNTERSLKALSKQTGVERNQLERMRIAFNTVGVSTESFNRVIGNLGEGLNQAKLGYGPLLEFSNKIGLNLYKSNGQIKETDQLLSELIDYARKVDNPALQSLLNKLAFGDLSPEQFNSLISKSADEFKSIASSASDLQASVSSEDQQALQDFQKHFTELKELIYKWGSEVVLGILPTINAALQYFIEFGRQVRDLRVYFQELGAAIVKIFAPIVDAISSIQEYIAPTGSDRRGYLEKTKKFFGEVWYDYTHPFQTIDKISRNVAGVGFLKDPAPINVTVNTTVPPGTSAEQARNIQDTSEKVYEQVGASWERQARQMTNNNAILGY